MQNKTQNFYTKCFKKHGQSPRGLSWNSKDTQEIRFRILMGLLGEDVSTCTLVDAGCGFGDLYEYLQERKKEPKSYIGIDCMAQFISIASSRFSKVVFLQRDILKDELPKADWYVASGSLNILSDFETWLFLEKMLLHSRKGLVFNILCGEKKSEIYNYKTQSQIEEFAKEKNLTCKVLTGYLDNDISVRLGKGK